MMIVTNELFINPLDIINPVVPFFACDLTEFTSFETTVGANQIRGSNG